MDDFNPDWASPPFDTVVEICEMRGLSEVDLCISLGLTIRELWSLIRGEARLTDKIAQRLSDEIGGSIEFWESRDEQYWQRKERLTDEC